MAEAAKRAARKAAKKEHPLSLRLPAGDLAVIDRAARLRGRSRTDFMREASVRAAEDILLESALVRMSPAGFAAFAAAIAQPATAVPAMVDVLKRTAPWDARPKRDGAPKAGGARG
jgi:uncharacterized protein (DUF1778 family)